MANTNFYFRGIARWAKVQKPDTKYDVYTLDLHLNDESWGMFKDSGLELKIREDDDNGDYVKLRRPVTKKTSKGLVDMGPPQVLLRKGDDYEAFDGLVGNGSEVICKVRVYDTEKGKGHELVTVAVEKLAEYTESVGGEDLPF